MTEFILSYFLKSAVLSAAILLIYLFLRLSRQRYSQSCRRFVWAAVIICLCLPFELLPSIVTFRIPHTADTDSESDISLTAPPNSESWISGGASATAPPSSHAESTAHQDSAGASDSRADSRADSGSDIIDDSLTENKATHDMQIAPNAFTLVCDIIFVGWAAGATGCLLYELIRCGVMQKKLSRELISVENERYQLYLKLCERLNIKHPPELYMCEYIHSPMLCGFIKPKILLPVLDISDNSAVGILGHELIHYKRHDLWLKLFGVVACSLHWFNPVAHFASRQLSQSIELACDEQLLDGLDRAARGSYGRVLLEIIRGCADAPNTLTTHFNPNRTAVKERFINIMDCKTKKRGIAVMIAALAVCLVAGGAFACTTGRAYGEPSDSGGQSNSLNLNECQNDSDNQNTSGSQNQSGNPDDGISAAMSKYDKSLTELLYMTVAEIHEKYGELTLEYSENGPGQPVYSISGFPGALIVFHSLDMDTPPADDRYPDEVMIDIDNSDIGTDNASIDSLYGLKLGTQIDDYDLYEWYHAGFMFTTRIANVSTVVDGVRLTAKMTDSGASPPDIGNGSVYNLWLNGWSEEYRKQPLGKIIELRLAVATDDDYPTTIEQKLINLLSATVGEIRGQYGGLTLEYSEHGPGQPVYSIAGFPGVLLVFHGLDMDTPPDDNYIPNEVMISADYPGVDSVFGFDIGSDISEIETGIEWYSCDYEFMNGGAHLYTVVEGIKLDVLMLGDIGNQSFVDNPDIDYDAGLAAWREDYLASPRGEIYAIRLAYADRDDYPPSDGSTHTATTLAEIMEAHNRGLISDTAYRFFYDLLSGSSTSFPEYDSVKISEFALTFTDTREDLYMTFDFTVSESGLDTLPPGSYHKRVIDGVCCWMEDFEQVEETHDWDSEPVLSDAVDMVETFISSSYIWNCPTYGKGVTYPGMHNYLCNYYGRSTELTLDEYKRLAADKFGCTDFDALGVDAFTYERDGVTYIQAGGLGGQSCWEVVSANRDGDEVMVTVQFWAECNALIRSHKITYTLTTDGKWLGYEIIEKSEYEPFGIRYIADEGESSSANQ